MTRTVRYIRYEDQDAYREAGWEIKPLTHSYMKIYALMAVKNGDSQAMTPIKDGTE